MQALPIHTLTPLDSVPLLDDGHASPLQALVQRLERRFESGRGWGRDVDTLIEELHETLFVHWPANPTHRTEFACRLATLAFAWAERATEPNRGLRALTDVAISRLDEALGGGSSLESDFADDLLKVWRAAPVEQHEILSRIIVGRASAAILARLDEILGPDVARQMGALGTLSRALTTRTVVPPGWLRNQAILLARIRARRNDVEGALRVLERESSTDPRILEAGAEILIDNERYDEGIERLRRALVVATDPERIREQLFEIALRRNDLETAIDQVRVLLEECSDLTYWYILVDVLSSRDPKLVSQLRDRLQERAPSLYVEILLAEGNRKKVAIASTGKTFSYELLWRMGDFLAATDAAAAAQVYERAFVLQGAVAQSRIQCTALANRVAAVLPFFVEFGRPTLLRRAAREMIARQKSNIPLRRELDRVFGMTF